MTFSEIEKLHEMGFSAEQIVTLSGATLSSDPSPAPDPLADKVTALDAKLNDFIKAMQANNLKTAVLDVLPNDQFEKSMDDALSEIIRPSFDKKED